MSKIEVEESVINAAVGLYPLIAVDPINVCCSEKFGRPELDITYRRIRQMKLNERLIKPSNI